MARSSALRRDAGELRGRNVCRESRSWDAAFVMPVAGRESRRVGERTTRGARSLDEGEGIVEKSNDVNIVMIAPPTETLSRSGGVGARRTGGTAPSLGAGHRTMAETVAAEIHRRILNGDFLPGEPLRIQDLAEQFDTSSMPVREALRQLAATGIVTNSPHKGARVSEVSKADLDDTFSVRFALEPLAAGLAARQGMSASEVEVAEAALERYLGFLADGNVELSRNAHEDFHYAIYWASRSTWLLRCIDPLWQNSERYRFAWGEDPAEHVEMVREEHQAVLDACIARDEAGAEEAMRLHLELAHARISRAIAANPPDSGHARDGVGNAKGAAATQH